MGKGHRNRARGAEGPPPVALRGDQRAEAGVEPAIPRDPHLPEFSRDQADALRAYAADAVRGVGLRAKDCGTHLVVTGGPFTGAGAQLGFSTIAREAQRLPEGEWNSMVAAVVGHLMAAAMQTGGRSGSLGYAGPALRERLFPRFVAPERMPPDQLAESHTYAREVGGLPLIMAIRRDQTSLFLADDHLAKAGGLEAAWEAAEANLFSAGLGKAEAYGREGTAVLLLESDHPRQASWLAYPERLMAHFGIEPGARGVLFGVPALRMLLFTVTEESVTPDGIRSMLELNAILAQDEVAPLSPHVYWWRPGGPVQAVTSWQGAEIALAPPAALAGTFADEDGRAVA